MDATRVPPATLARRRRVEHRRFDPRISAHEEDEVGILHADDVTVEEIRRARVSADALDTLGDGVTCADAVEEILQRDDGLRVAQLSSHRPIAADPSAILFATVSRACSCEYESRAGDVARSRRGSNELLERRDGAARRAAFRRETRRGGKSRRILRSPWTPRIGEL